MTCRQHFCSLPSPTVAPGAHTACFSLPKRNKDGWGQRAEEASVTEDIRGVSWKGRQSSSKCSEMLSAMGTKEQEVAYHAGAAERLYSALSALEQKWCASCFQFPSCVGFFLKLNLELVGVGVLISMCTACTSHTRTFCRIAGREITACVKGKMVWRRTEAQLQGCLWCMGCTSMHHLFHCLYFLKKERGKKSPENVGHQRVVFPFWKQMVFSIRLICPWDNQSKVYKSKH